MIIFGQFAIQELHHAVEVRRVVVKLNRRKTRHFDEHMPRKIRQDVRANSHRHIIFFAPLLCVVQFFIHLRKKRVALVDKVARFSKACVLHVRENAHARSVETSGFASCGTMRTELFATFTSGRERQAIGAPAELFAFFDFGIVGG